MSGMPISPSFAVSFATSGQLNRAAYLRIAEVGEGRGARFDSHKLALGGTSNDLINPFFHPFSAAFVDRGSTNLSHARAREGEREGRRIVARMEVD